MRRLSKLTLTEENHQVLRDHLFCGDGRESAALILCTCVRNNEFVHYLTRKLILVPNAECSEREVDFIRWPGNYLESAIDEAEDESLTLLLIHSHPGGFLEFSGRDNQSDRAAIPCLHQTIECDHGSALMIESGAMRARLYTPKMQLRDIDVIQVVGQDITLCWNDGRGSTVQRPVAFTSRMRAELQRMSASVIGVSGIGSIVVEQLARLGFGEIVLVDFDRIEHKNLNRILNSTIADADSNRLKVDCFEDAIHSYRKDASVIKIPKNILDREAILAVASTDVIFSCVDTLEARQICDLIAMRFMIPLFDAGVTIPTRKQGNRLVIGDVCGRIDYVKPGGATLGDRKVYTPERLRAEYLASVDKEAHDQELNAGYIKGIFEEAPSVVSLNMRAGAALVNEFLARVYPFRLDPNDSYSRTSFSLAACEEEYFPESEFEKGDNMELGLGDIEPLLGIPSI